MAECPACGAEVEMGRLTGILGVVCRKCDAYNEPGAKSCVSCGQPLSAARPAAGAARAAPKPAVPEAAKFADLSVARLSDLPPLELDAFAPTSPPAPAAQAVAAPARAPAASPYVPSPFGDFDLELPPRLAAVVRTPTPPPPRDLPGMARTPPTPSSPPRDLPAVARTPTPPPPRDLPAAQPASKPREGNPPPTDQTQPIQLVTACPHCGAEAGGGAWCIRCGQPIGAAHTRPMAAPPPEPGQRTPSQVFGPPEPGKATLVLERGAGFEGAVFRLSGQEVGAGRTQGAILFPDDGSLAPLHVTFLYRDERLFLRDEGSPSGTYVRLRGLSIPLKPGDLFALGDRLLRFGGPLPPAPPPPSDGTRRLGSPRPAGLAVLVEERLEGGTTGRVWLRGGPSVTLGRAGCAINLGDDPFLSQAHAEIVLEPDGTAKLRDLGSSNGTFVRIEPQVERELHDGDVLRIGREVLRVVSGPR